MISLTPRQQDALRFITGYHERNGISPSLREIAQGIGLESKTVFTVQWLLQSLEERGVIVRTGRQRAIAVLEPLAIPRAPDGEPLHFVRIGECAA